jgi:hypothetical protein
MTPKYKNQSQKTNEHFYFVFLFIPINENFSVDKIGNADHKFSQHVTNNKKEETKKN